MMCGHTKVHKTRVRKQTEHRVCIRTRHGGPQTAEQSPDIPTGQTLMLQSAYNSHQSTHRTNTKCTSQRQDRSPHAHRLEPK